MWFWSLAPYYIQLGKQYRLRSRKRPKIPPDDTVINSVAHRLGIPQESGLSHASGSSGGPKSAWDDVDGAHCGQHGMVLVEPPEPSFLEMTHRSSGETDRPLGVDVHEQAHKASMIGKRHRTLFDRAQSNNTDNTDNTELSDVNTLNSVSTSQMDPSDVARMTTFERKDSSELIISSQRPLHKRESASAMTWDDNDAYEIISSQDQLHTHESASAMSWDGNNTYEHVSASNKSSKSRLVLRMSGHSGTSKEMQGEIDA